MRYGFSSNLVATQKDPVGIEIVEDLARFGYDFIELPICEVMKLPDSDYDTLKKRILSSGISCDVCNMFFSPTMRLTGENVDYKSIETYYLKVMQRAVDLGIKTIVFGSPGAKSFPSDFQYQLAYEQLLHLHYNIDKAARKYGLIIVIEPVRSPECNLIITFEEACKLAEEINGTNTRVLVDYYHMTWERESPEVIRKYGKKWLHHVHFAAPYIPGEGERNVPLDINEWTYTEFIEALKEIDYDNTITIEAYTRDFVTQAPKGLSLMKKYF